MFVAYRQLVLWLCFCNFCIVKSDTNVTESDDIRMYNNKLYCKLQPINYDCTGNGTEPTFYYDTKMGGCRTTSDGGCEHNYNSFKTIGKCHADCWADGQISINTAKMPANIYCRLQPDFGKCNGYYPMYYYDMSDRRCKGFSFSGCGGNHNRFPNNQICAAVCFSAISY